MILYFLSSKMKIFICKTMTVSVHPVDRHAMWHRRVVLWFIKSVERAWRLSCMEVKSGFNQRGRFHARRLSLIPAMQLVHLW